MKKNILILVGSLAFCLGTAEAQQRDSARADQNKRSEERQGTDQARQPRYDQQQGTNARYNSGDIEIISNNDIPEALRQSLRSDDRYQGWENAVIYHNKKTGEYLVSPRAHRFDGEGKPIGQSTTMDRRSLQKKTKEPASADQSKRGESATSEQTTAQDTASSQAMSATDQGRMQSTEGRMSQDAASKKNQDGNVDTNKEAVGEPQQSDRYRNDGVDTGTETEIPMEGMIEMQSGEVPESLRQTLTDNDYKGWETGKLYRHGSTGDYLLIVEERKTGEGKQVYRFDKDGKIKSDKNK